MKITKKHLKWGALSVMLLAAIWSILIEPRWLAKREISFQLTEDKALNNLKVVVATDWHITQKPLKRIMTAARASKIVDAINRSQPDIILLPGDFIAEQSYQAPQGSSAEAEIAAILGRLKAKHGVYAVLGNHDWWFGGSRFTRALQEQGITVLENDAFKFPSLDLWLVGIGDDTTNHARINQALAKVPKNAPLIAMLHDPGAMKKLSSHWHNSQALFVAGHTHGGQVYLPFWGAIILPGTSPLSWAYGWVNTDKFNMYVSSGLGVSIFPVRFNMRPEWVEFSIE